MEALAVTKAAGSSVVDRMILCSKLQCPACLPLHRALYWPLSIMNEPKKKEINKLSFFLLCPHFKDAHGHSLILLIDQPKTVDRCHDCVCFSCIFTASGCLDCSFRDGRGAWIRFGKCSQQPNRRKRKQPVLDEGSC